MRILHFYKTAFPSTMGGVEQVIDQIARGTSALGFHNDVLSLGSVRNAPVVTINGYRSHRAALDFEIASTGFSREVLSRFKMLAREADVIHYHFPWPFMDLVHFASRTRKPTVVTYHSDVIRQKHLLRLYQPLMRKFLKSVDRIVATSPNYVATSEVLQRFAEKVSVIPIGIDQATYPVAGGDRLEFWRRQFGPKFFLFVGVLRYYKGLHILIEAARGTDYPIVIVGSGPIEQELKLQASRLGVANVYFLGQLPEEDKVALLELSFGVVFPSHLRSEAFGVSLLEGAMFAKPMISSEIGTGTTFINVSGKTGLVVDPGDADALRLAMKYLWQHEDIAAEMGRRAALRYQSYFTARQMALSYANLYRQLPHRR